MSSCSAVVGAIAQAGDQNSAIRAALRTLCEVRRGRWATVAVVEPGHGRLFQAWTGPGPAEPRPTAPVDPDSLHPLLRIDAAAGRPVRPVDGLHEHLRDEMLPGLGARPGRLWVRALAVDSRLVAVLLVAEPRSAWDSRPRPELQTAADALELVLARFGAEQRNAATVHHSAADAEQNQRIATERLAEAERVMESMAERIAALDQATGHATEMLEAAHLELHQVRARESRAGRSLAAMRSLLDEHEAGVSPEQLATRLVDLASDVSGGARCSLLLPEPRATSELRLAAARGLPVSVDARATRVVVGDRVSGWVAKYRAPVRVRDRREATRFPRNADASYTGAAFVSVPLVCRGASVGVLNMANFGPEGEPDDRALEQIELFARCVALLVDHARLSERLFA